MLVSTVISRKHSDQFNINNTEAHFSTQCGNTSDFIRIKTEVEAMEPGIIDGFLWPALTEL